ncbi:helix-turn-helix domain-containing protein [Flagellimonas sp. CMM7]|uniref:helix-turn-helix domain-containing protein n=1 Tax=Flagellimonas sp. CMM7 TaxID=2654676 RepID=UPI0013D4A976|nr:helix-turn-helix domain-containing protein [Flagellimonas sp. CMM7]UII80042.1 hypothetical protein LV704_00625 [Flagellimonas sp. CMM7]
MSKLETIIECVEAEFGLDLQTKSRKSQFTNARYIYYMLAMKLTKTSLHRIASKIGFDHATLIHYRDNFVPSQRFKSSYFDILEAFRSKEYVPENLEEVDVQKLMYQRDELNEKIFNLESKIRYLMNSTKSPEEENLVRIFRGLTKKKREELMFKARTTLKVQQKMSAA